MRRPRPHLLTLAVRLPHLGRHALLCRHVLRALPPETLPLLAATLACLERVVGTPAWQRAREAWRLAFAHRAPGTPAVLREACTHAWLDRLQAARARPSPRRGAHAGPPPGPLYLAPRLGRPRGLARLARDQGLRLAGLEGTPQRQVHAAHTVWLGQPALRSTRRIARALACGRPVRLLLGLPRPGTPGLAWHASPNLAEGAAGAGEVLQRALDAQALLARARPDLVDWSQRRGRQRASLARAGLASWTRLPPWAARHGTARAARRAPAGPGRPRPARAGPARAR